MTLYKWSQTASADATADGTINWAEGQSPSSVNDSARAMMASIAGYRDDIAGAIVTGGTSTAYTVSSYEVFDTLAHMANQMIAFTPHTTNGATVTLNVDGLGAKPLRSAPSTDLLAGVLIQGTPYVATYNNSDAAWYLQNFYANPYSVPLGAGMDFWGTTAPNAAFAFPAGQAISRTTYAPLFALFGTGYGAGDGSTTFNLPNKAGRVSAMREAVATLLTSAVSGVDGGTLNSAGGAQSQTLTTAQLAVTTPAGTISAITPAGTISAITPAGTVGVTVTTPNVLSGGTSDNYTSTAGTGTWNTPTRGSLAATGSFTGTPVTPIFTGSASTPIFTGTSFGSGQAHANVQPTIICNYILRVL
jgi:microcystin-dependent protein